MPDGHPLKTKAAEHRDIGGEPAAEHDAEEGVATVEIDALIRQLGDEEWKKREVAQRRLAAMGRPALPSIRAATRSSDMETALRARALMKEMVGSGWMGTEVRDLMPAERQALELPENEGVLISRILEDTPAAKVNLAPGDVLQRLDGEPLHGASDLVERISMREPGSKVKFLLWRDGKRSELEMVLGRRPVEHQLPEDAPAAQPEIE